METISSFEAVLLGICGTLAAKWVCERLFCGHSFVYLLINIGTKKRRMQYSLLRLWEKIIWDSQMMDTTMTFNCDNDKKGFIKLKVSYWTKYGDQAQVEHQFTIHEWIYDIDSCVQQLQRSIDSIADKDSSNCRRSKSSAR
jgi:hypothetical protein